MLAFPPKIILKNTKGGCMLPNDGLRSSVFSNCLDMFYNLSISNYASDHQYYPVSSLRGRAIALIDIGVHIVCITNALPTLLYQTAHLVYRITLHIRFLKTDLWGARHSLVAPALNTLVGLTPHIHIIRADLYGLLIPEWGRTYRVFYALHILRNPINLQESLSAEQFLTPRSPHSPAINTAASVGDDDALRDRACAEVDLNRSSACKGMSSNSPAANAAIDDDLEEILENLDKIKRGLSPTERAKWDSLFQEISDAATQKQPLTQLFNQGSLWMQKYLFLSTENHLPTALQHFVDDFVRYVQQLKNQRDIWRNVLYVDTHRLVPPSEIENDPQLLVRWAQEKARRARTDASPSQQDPGYDVLGFNQVLVAIRNRYAAKELAPWEPLLRTLAEGVSQHQAVIPFIFYFREDLRFKLLEGISGIYSKRQNCLLSFPNFIVKQPPDRASELLKLFLSVPSRLRSYSELPANVFNSHEIYADWLISKGRELNL